MAPKFSRIIYDALAFAVLLYGIEIWSLRKEREKKIDINQDETLRRTAGHALFDHKKYEEILEELKIEQNDEKRRRYKSNCLQHVTRMENNSVPKIMPKYRRNGQRGLGRPFEETIRRSHNRSIKV